MADAVVGYGRRNIEPRIAIEEANRLEAEADGRDRHDRPVLGPHHVMRPEGVPDHHVGIHDRAIVARVRRQACAAGMLVRVIAGGVSLARTIRRYPQMPGGERATLQNARAFARER